MKALSFLAVLFFGAFQVALARPKPPAPAPVPEKPSTMSIGNKGQTLLSIWQQENFCWTEKVAKAYLVFSKAEALKEIKQAGQSLPQDFLQWVDSEPEVAYTIYAQSPENVANRLRLLRSLEIDLGKDAIRKKYTQLALAMVVVNAAEGEKADLSERKPLELKIPGDPRILVDTHPKNRLLDVNDHIINFLNDHAPIPDDGHGKRVIFPELVYDEKGIAIPNPQLKTQETENPPKATDLAAPKTRQLFACDVIASEELEKEFNEYMKAHGQNVQINCSGQNRLSWGSQAFGTNQAGIRGAFQIFLNAYKAKGYFPAQPDPVPTPAESLAFYIKINEYAPEAGARPAPPKFPFAAAPWPILTFLAMDRQPLRVREDMWQRYKSTGEFHGYGEYIGKIAQNSPMLQARRLTPFAFNYGSQQMMCKDGGVCGTMATMSVFNHMALGAPASTAGQPGHCALVKFQGPAGGPFQCKGGQYATAGDAGTNVKLSYIFDGGSRRKMFAHQSVAYCVNAGEMSFLRSLAARSFYLSLPPAEKKAHGFETLKSAIVINPYNLAVFESALSAATTPAEVIQLCESQLHGLKSVEEKPGCPPKTCLAITTMRSDLYAKLLKLPLPADSSQSRKIYAFLQSEKCDVEKLNTDYLLSAEDWRGEQMLLEKLDADFKAHLAGSRNPAACAVMAQRIDALAKSACAPAKRDAALASFKELLKGHETYEYVIKHRRRQEKKTATDNCAALLDRLVKSA